MRWTPGGLSDIEDRRGGGGFSFGRGPQIGCAGAIILLVLSLLTGRNFFTFLDGSGGSGTAPSGPTSTAPVEQTPEEEQSVQFVNFTLKDIQDNWTNVFRQEGIEYQRTTLVVRTVSKRRLIHDVPPRATASPI